MFDIKDKSTCNVPKIHSQQICIYNSQVDAMKAKEQIGKRRHADCSVSVLLTLVGNVSVDISCRTQGKLSGHCIFQIAQVVQLGRKTWAVIAAVKELNEALGECRPPWPRHIITPTSVSYQPGL